MSKSLGVYQDIFISETTIDLFMIHHVGAFFFFLHGGVLKVL